MNDTEKQMDKIKLKLNELLNTGRQMELRIDTMKQVMVCEVDHHDWRVHSSEGDLTSLHSVKLWCGQCPCYVDLTLHQPSIMILRNNFSQTLTSFLGGEEE